MPSSADGPRVGLFVTCLVDAIRPQRRLRRTRICSRRPAARSRCREAQTCCGQPAFNRGDDATTPRDRRGVIAAFEPYDYVVVPSGSCAGMIRATIRELFADEPAWRRARGRLAAGRWELLSFLVDVHGLRARGRALRGACDLSRQLLGPARARRARPAARAARRGRGAGAAAARGRRRLLRLRRHLLREVSRRSPTPSSRRRRTRSQPPAPTLLLGGDLGCLMNMAGKLSRRGSAGAQLPHGRGAGRHGRRARPSGRRAERVQQASTASRPTPTRRWPTAR